ncbi:unnamed protein product [Rotaria sordida]|uniref:Uncharacterized protein n=1 Tax=Rotaria sordida TaxID=392033 RepID=A0A815BEC0_9BILA|nr:unnamed protein product [Rotaria sordida]CAF1549055.1 unnamed protein product [Rotaria sordida]
MSTYASTTTTTTLGPKLSPSIIQKDEQQCLPINTLHIDRLCSKTCRAQKTPFEKLDNINQLLLNSHYLPFCSNYTLNHSINQTNFFNEITENECRKIFNQLIIDDEEARKASILFATYMQAIDSALAENRYSIINSDCLKAYQTWTCSVKIRYFYQNHLIPPCHTICDEVERVCPTFRPSDREPLFAGQPLFFCNGGIVPNRDYGQQPYCFDTCHLADGSFQLHSVSSSSNKSILTKTNEDHVTRLPCFEIELLPFSPSEELLLPLSINNSLFNYTNNTSISASAISIISSVWSTIIVNILTYIFIFLFRLL